MTFILNDDDDSVGGGVGGSDSKDGREEKIVPDERWDVGAVMLRMVEKRKEYWLGC